MSTDIELLDRWGDGDRKAGNELFRRHFDRVSQFLSGKLQAEADADELIQSTFFALVKHREQVRKATNFRTYLLTMAKNELYRYLRERYRGKNIDFATTSLRDLRTTASSRMAKGEQKQILLEALRSLPIEQQLLIEMHYWQGIATEALAPVFDIAPATVRTRLHRARKDLRARMADASGRPPGAAEDDLEAWARGLEQLGPPE